MSIHIDSPSEFFLLNHVSSGFTRPCTAVVQCSPNFQLFSNVHETHHQTHALYFTFLTASSTSKSPLPVCNRAKVNSPVNVNHTFPHTPIPMLVL